MSNKPIKEEWTEYYIYLEVLRQSNVTNMYGSASYLRDDFGIGRREAIDIVANWMHNYEELLEKKIIRRND